MTDLKISMKPVKKTSLYLKISDAIYSYIQMNKLQPGDKLPSERDMSSMLQTSRNSVREALRILEDRGLIEVKTGLGVFIRNPYGEQSTLTIRLQNCSICEIQELQRLLDHQAVKKCH
ncbi:FadR/GntR family transcriptional regulator [Mediterraneibacter gnavus]|uniref:FadR/GntR family transcriptional regulator n=1 Tax=Mediterraneibacter gnavus TaxID=33038 RepID=UPI000A70A3B4|nr:GntR family transcriptional regulator [Mediterraneibacter gnavus]